MICHQCGTDIDLERVPSRLETCPECTAYMHCCLNCRFYDPTMSNSCLEPQAEYVPDKAAGNFCEFFQPNRKEGGSRREVKGKDPKKAFEGLFKDLN